MKALQKRQRPLIRYAGSAAETSIGSKPIGSELSSQFYSRGRFCQDIGLAPAKALDIEAMLTAELRIRLDQDDAFRPLSEKLQRLIDEKRAGTLAGIALIEELEKLTDAVRAAVEEANRPVPQQLALKVKARNAAITDALAAEIAAATLTEADKHCFPGWWGSSTVDPELSRGLLFMVATRFSSAGLLTDDAMGFIGSLVQVLKRRHYKPGAPTATGD